MDDETHDIVIQGASADPTTLARTAEDSLLPDHEGVVRLPARMIPLLREALDGTKPE
ncbi:hypothetical protein [Streptomyces sp. NPDC046385]|uniref:hypothetical protein n=1 Tax=unclassified Streptomyces TaxID=2593676 RepID=UPI0033F7C1FB